MKKYLLVFAFFMSANAFAEKIKIQIFGEIGGSERLFTDSPGEFEATWDSEYEVYRVNTQTMRGIQYLVEAAVGVAQDLGQDWANLHAVAYRNSLFSSYLGSNYPILEEGEIYSDDESESSEDASESESSDESEVEESEQELSETEADDSKEEVKEEDKGKEEEAPAPAQVRPSLPPRPVSNEQAPPPFPPRDEGLDLLVSTLNIGPSVQVEASSSSDHGSQQGLNFTATTRRVQPGIQALLGTLAVSLQASSHQK